MAKVAVSVQVVGGKRQGLSVSSGATIRAVLKALKMDPEQYNGAVALNGEQAELSDRISGGDRIDLTPKVAGGR